MSKQLNTKQNRQPSLFELEKPTEPASRPFSLPSIFLGTSSFTASGWEGSFYPIGMRSKDFLRHYASQFQTVEIDSTFYGTPSASTVTSWNEKTPRDFIFAVKIPQVITHEKVLVDCEPEFDEFVERMHLLGDKLGPMLLQFPKFDKWVLKSPDEFRGRLQSFFKHAADLNAGRFAVEVRNKDWLDARLTDLLREHNVALALTDTSFMPRPWEMKGALDLVTADFTSQYQAKEKERDRARAETADYLERERKVVEDAFNATGRVIAASEDMIQATSTAFDERHRTSSELTTIRSKKQEIVNHYNDADGNWHAQRTTLTLRLRMEHGANEDVSSAWDKTSSAVTEFSDCARIWFEQHLEPVDKDKLKEACASRKHSLEQNLDTLTREILKSRQASSMSAKP